MKDLQNIDDLFSRSLENFEVPPPIDAKKAIDQELHKKANKKNRKGGWLLLAIVSMSVIATAMFVQNKNNHNMATINKTESEANEVQMKINSVSDYSSEQDLSSSSKNLISEENEKEIETTSFNDSPKLNEYTEKQQQNNHQITNTTNTAKALNIKEKGPDLLKSSETPNKQSSNEVINKLSKSNEITNTHAEPLTLDNFKVSEEMKEPIAMNQNAIMASVDQTSIVANDSAMEAPSENNGPNKIVEPRPKSRSYFVAINYGMGFNSNHFDKSNSVATQELKDSIKFNKPYYNVQLLGGMQFNNFSIATGISIFKQTEKIQYSYINQSLERILVDSIYIDPITNDTIVKHNVPVDTLMNHYKTNTNQTVYTALQIPLIMSSHILLGERFVLNLSAGGAVNILLHSKGNYKVSSAGSLSDYESKSKAPLQTFSFNAMAIIGLNYNLNGRTSLQFALPFQIGLSNVYKKEYFIHKNVNSAGLQIGLKYDF